MNRLTLLITASLAANVALLGYIALRPGLAGHTSRSTSPTSEYASRRLARSSAGTTIADGASSDSPRPVSTVPPAHDVPPPETWSRLQSADLATFTANLRAAGLPERQVRMLVIAEINDRFRDREQAVRPPRVKREFWEQGRTYYNDPTTMEQRLAQLDLRREKLALRRELLGDSPRDADEDNPIPSGKRDLLRAINEDYNTMMSQIRRDSRGIPLASDEENLRYLREEKEAELKALLTPEELREYELRSSPTANRLRNDLAAFGATEQEFRALFALRQKFDEQFATHPPDAGPDYWKQRNEAQKALDAQIARQLGPERYRDYARSKDHEYRNLAALTDRLNLPQTLATHIYDLRYSVPADALKIVRDESLTPAAKQEGLKAIAQKTRNQLASQLGSEASEAYLKRHGEWIKSLERGHVIEYKPDGSRTSHGIPQK